MKKLQILSVTIVLLLVCMFSGCSLFDESVAGCTFVCSDINVVFNDNSDDFDESEKQAIISNFENRRNETVTFNSDGTITTDFPFIIGRTWSQEGNKLVISKGLQSMTLTNGSFGTFIRYSEYEVTFRFTKN